MAERQDATEVSSFIRDENPLSPDDLAWVDSCLANVPEYPDSKSWDNMREALIDVMDNHHESFVPPSTRIRFPVEDEDMAETESSDQPTTEVEANSMNPNGSATEEVSEILSLLTFEPDPSKNSLQDDNFSTHGSVSMAISGTLDPLNNPQVQEYVERTENGSASDEEAEVESALSEVVKDDLMESPIQDNVADPFDDFNVPEDRNEVSSCDIFRVWDLEIPADENEDEVGLEQQLEKALKESSKERLPPQPLDDDDLVGQETGDIDDLIAGISDLSLSENFR